MNSPMIPNVDKTTYDAERDPVNVLRSVARRVQIGPFAFNLTAEDWGSILNCEKAASRAGEILRIYHPAFDKNAEVTKILDDLADRIVGELGIDPARPFGCSLIVEPV